MYVAVCRDNDLSSWRDTARRLVNAGVKPDEIVWGSDGQLPLLPEADLSNGSAKRLVVPAQFVSMADNVACFDGGEKWPLLYRILYRLAYEDRRLLNIESDPDVLTARRMAKSVSRDIHKFHAFVRFRSVTCGDEDVFTAWHEPQHFTVEKATPFFARRFGTMKFSILTPKGCAHWDKKQLLLTPGVARPQMAEDETEVYWLTYYRSIFNPFRLKLQAMKSEMPVRHWATLPEAALIRELVESAGRDQN